MIQSLRRLASELERRAAGLQERLDRRILVEQAKGVLAERLQLPVEASASILERVAATRGIPDHRLAADVVSGSVDLDLRPAS